MFNVETCKALSIRGVIASASLKRFSGVETGLADVGYPRRYRLGLIEARRLRVCLSPL